MQDVDAIGHMPSYTVARSPGGGWVSSRITHGIRMKKIRVTPTPYRHTCILSLTACVCHARITLGSLLTSAEYSQFAQHGRCAAPLPKLYSSALAYDRRPLGL